MKIGLWYVIAALIIVLDQQSKGWASETLEYSPMVFTSFFNFTLAHNYGAAFSFLADAGGWQQHFLSGLAIVVSGVIIVWIARVAKDKWWESAALALVLGGALGNVIDRLQHGYVVDFIVVHYQQYYWPTFNVADMAISAGAIMLVLDALFGIGAAKTKPAELQE
jgi:signal peptidase II